MKKIMILICFLIAEPTLASVYCLDNSKHLEKDYDNKEVYPVACDCPCTTIKGNRCIECGHLQNAATYVLALPTKIAHQWKIRIPDNPLTTLKKLAHRYLQKKSNE